MKQVLKMNLNLFKLLTEELVFANNDSLVTSLICKPTPEQMQKLREGDGNPEAEMRQVNSSAGLAVNYWRAYELCHPKSKVEFEWKERVPLKRGKPANIDVVVKEGSDVRFIESKFLEPYYSDNETPRQSYFDPSKYSKCTKDTPKSWVELFKQCQGFKYYNVTQLCRHLLAVSKDMWVKPKYYAQKRIQLCSVVWDMPDSFIDLYTEDVAEEFVRRRKIVRAEAVKAEHVLNEFINAHLNFVNLVFRAIKYNDILNEIQDSRYYSKIKEKYFLER